MYTPEEVKFWTLIDDLFDKVQLRGNREFDPARIFYERLLWNHKDHWEHGWACPWLGPFSADYTQHLYLVYLMKWNSYHSHKAHDILRKNIGAFSMQDRLQLHWKVFGKELHSDKKRILATYTNLLWEYLPCTFLRRRALRDKWQPPRYAMASFIRIEWPKDGLVDESYWEASPPYKAGYNPVAVIE